MSKRMEMREILDMIMSLYYQTPGANLKTFLVQQTHHLLPQLVILSARQGLKGKFIMTLLLSCNVSNALEIQGFYTFSF